MALMTPNTNPAGQDIHTEKLTGVLQSVFYEKTKLRDKFTIHPVVGTDTISKRRIGQVTLQAHSKGVALAGSAMDSDKLYLKVTNAIRSRKIIDIIDDIQNDFNAQTAIATAQGNELAKKFDQALFTQVMKGARISTPPISGFGVGNVSQITGTQGHLDPAKIAGAIDAVAQSMEQQNVDVVGSDDIEVYLPPAQYHALVQSDLVNRDFNGDNGSRAGGVVRMASGCKVHNTNLLPTAVVTNDIMGNDYNVTATEAKCVGLVFGSDALFVGESLKIKSKIWHNDDVGADYVDAYLSFNAIPDRLEQCGVIDKA